MTTRPGELNWRVELQKPRTDKSASGAVTDGYDTFDTVWAKVTPRGGGETQEAAQTRARASFEVTIRYRTDIDTTMRILHRGRPLNIESTVNENEADTWLILTCTEDA